jgi:uncharacterized membrane protein YbaN (DUF454 family)
VFVLIAAWCFTKASPRMEAWLRGHRVFGRYLGDWERDRSIPRGAKVAAGLGMLSSVLIAGVVFGVTGIPFGAMALTLAAVFSWIVRRPEPPRGRPAERAEASGGVALADEPA